MLQVGERIRFTVVQLGALNRAEVDNAVGLANQTQRALDFVFHPTRIPLKRQYKLPNGGYDLDQAVNDTLRRHTLPQPLLFLTDAAYGDRDHSKSPGWFYFADYELEGHQHVAIVSTHLWRSLPPPRPLQPYILLSFASMAFSVCAGLQTHEETRGCPGDYCDNPADIDNVLGGQDVCSDCRRSLNARLRAGRLGLDQVAAANKLLTRARNRRTAFVVMPFRRRLDPAYQAVHVALAGNGWDVDRADRLSHPRRITDAIVQAILSSHLIVADITGRNPNVFYELGIAHAAGIDVLMLTQDRSAIPFDVRTERAIRYSLSPAGLSRLTREVVDMTL